MHFVKAHRCPTDSSSWGHDFLSLHTLLHSHVHRARLTHTCWMTFAECVIVIVISFHVDNRYDVVSWCAEPSCYMHHEVAHASRFRRHIARLRKATDSMFARVATHTQYVTQITTLQSSWSHRQLGDADRRRHTSSGHHEGSRSDPVFFGRSMSPVAFLVFAMVKCRGIAVLMHRTKCQNASRNTEFRRC